jgi:hypothetical protein
VHGFLVAEVGRGNQGEEGYLIASELARPDVNSKDA